MRRIRLVPDNTHIPFMRGRLAGLLVSMLLSIASLGMFFYPGMNYGIDFKGGIVMEVRTPEPVQFAPLRSALSDIGVGEVGLQQFGTPEDVLIRVGRQPGDEAAQQRAVQRVRGALEQFAPGTQVRRVESVGARVSEELFIGGMTALGLALLIMLLYIWFRFEWQFGVGAVVTLVLDVTKAIGFLSLTQIEFNLVTVAALLTIIGYSVNDKVVVYDRMRENLRKFKSMPLRQLIDQSINETLSRTIGTSATTFLSCLPLAVIGGEALQGFAFTMMFGIIVGTSSSIFIAAPILLYLGEGRLRRGPVAEGAPAPEGAVERP